MSILGMVFASAMPSRLVSTVRESCTSSGAFVPESNQQPLSSCSVIVCAASTVRYTLRYTLSAVLTITPRLSSLPASSLVPIPHPTSNILAIKHPPPLCPASWNLPRNPVISIGGASVQTGMN